MSQTYLLSRKERKNRCVQGLLYIKTIMSKLLLKIKNVPIYGLIQPKLKKVSKNEWKPLEKPACIFLKFIEVHLWPDFTASNQHIWVYWGFPDRLTHIIRVGFYPSFIYSWYILEHEFFCFWPFGQLRAGCFFKLFMGKKVFALK